MNKLKSKQYKAVITALLCTVFILNLNGCARKKEAVVIETKNVKAVSASIGSISTNIEYPAKLFGVSEINIMPKTPGKVSAVYFDVGQKVNKGDILFTLDTKELNAQYNASRASLESANANYVKTTDSAYIEQLNAAESSLKLAKTALDDEQKRFDQNEKLYNMGAISKQAYDDIKSRYENAKTNYERAQASYNNLKQKSGPQNESVAYSQVKQAEAGLNSVAVLIDNTIIRSPISGFISTKNVEVGEFSPQGLPSFVVVDSSSIIAQVSLPAKMIDKISVGQLLSLKVAEIKDKTIEGIVENISQAADIQTQTYLIKIKIDNKDGLLKSGMFARVMLPAEKKDNIIVVPNEAIKVENGVFYVYTVNGDLVKKVAVETGISNDTHTEVLNNISENTKIITEGQTFLNEGDKVRIINN